MPSSLGSRLGLHRRSVRLGGGGGGAAAPGTAGGPPNLGRHSAITFTHLNYTEGQGADAEGDLPWIQQPSAYRWARRRWCGAGVVLRRWKECSATQCGAVECCGCA